MEPEEFLAAQIRQRKQAGKWGRGIFRDVKSLSATSKGQLEEDFIVWLAKQRKMRAEPAPSKRGDYDILVNGQQLESLLGHHCWQSIN